MSGVHEPLQATPETSKSDNSPVLLPAIARLGLPMLIFGVVFVILAWVLTILVSPDRFPVRVGESIVRLADLQSEERRLKSKHAELTDERRKILENVDAPVLRQVEERRAGTIAVGSVLQAVNDVRAAFKLGASDPIAIPGVYFDAAQRRLTISGTVTDPGGRSIQILASFVDGLRKIPGVAGVSEPEYGAQESVSPFSITLTLNNGQ